MCLRKSLLILALIVFCASLFYASPAPSSASSVVLSPTEAASVSAALDQSTKALQASSEEIKAQSTQIKRLRIFCGVLAIAVILDLIERAGEALYRAIK